MSPDSPRDDSDRAAPREITRILRQETAGDGAAEALLAAVYDQLRVVARHRMAQERKEHTLDATALVHEVWMRLDGGPQQWQNRAHFFAAAAEAMRRILIEHARARGSQKRGGGRRHVAADVADLAAHGEGHEILEFEDALLRLGAEDPRAADVVRLRFYGGLSFAEIAEALAVSERTALREWSFARARLSQLLALDGEGGDGGDGGEGAS
ncbi:MAG: ECF-type sigma factor [Planctomycetota bacterium]